MDDNWKKIDGLNLGNIPTVTPDFSYALKQQEQQWQEVSQSIDEMNRLKAEREQAKLDAARQTAENTEQMKGALDNVIINQNQLITILNENNEKLEEQNEILSAQLQKLRDLFVSQEDGVAVTKETRALIEQLLTEASKKDHKIRDFIADKGIDGAIAAVSAVLPGLLKLAGILAV